MTRQLRLGLTGALALLALGSGSAWALTKTCLTGTDPAAANDAAQINAVRNLIDVACPCADFDGTTGRKHSDYVRCARVAISEQVAFGDRLRSQCIGTTTRIYSHSTCGLNPALHAQPCVKRHTASGKVSCSIKPTTRSDGVTPQSSCNDGGAFTADSCPGFSTCLDAADVDADVQITAADGGACGPIGGNRRPVTVHVPPSYSPGTPMPLVVMLHGYTASGALEESYLQLTAQADARGFIYAYPDGTVDQFGNRFWNATPACCDLFATGIDDSGYLSGVITSLAAKYSVDPKRVYVIGHSNGGFMSYRMACDHADQIAAIASLAGAMFDDVSSCTPANPVSVLEIHGTADNTILYAGGSIAGRPYPGAETSIEDWVSLDGCVDSPDLSAPPLDLVATLAGAETDVTRFQAGCASASGVELWTMNGASHIPAFTPQFAPGLVDFLFAHPKP